MKIELSANGKYKIEVSTVRNSITCIELDDYVLTLSITVDNITVDISHLSKLKKNCIVEEYWKAVNVW